MDADAKITLPSREYIYSVMMARSAEIKRQMTMSERRVELEDTASGGFSLVLWYEDGGMDQIMLTATERAELRTWLNDEDRTRIAR